MPSRNHSNRSRNPRSGVRAGYEQRDANAKWIFGIIAVLLVLGLIMHFSLAGVLGRFEKRPDSPDALAGVRSVHSATEEAKNFPRLQLAPPEDLKRFRASEEVELNTYGWINRTDGVVRIPVERAMELVLERGLPVRAAGAESGRGPSSYELQQKRAQDASGGGQ